MEVQGRSSSQAVARGGLLVKPALSDEPTRRVLLQSSGLHRDKWSTHSNDVSSAVVGEGGVEGRSGVGVVSLYVSSVRSPGHWLPPSCPRGQLFCPASCVRNLGMENVRCPALPECHFLLLTSLNSPQRQKTTRGSAWSHKSARICATFSRDIAWTMAAPDPFYLRYYSGHSGRFGHEFLGRISLNWVRIF